jgi:hypothetical protein
VSSRLASWSYVLASPIRSFAATNGCETWSALPCTSLGKEFNIDLQQVFMGLWDPWDAVHVLLGHHLIGEDEADALFDLLENEINYEPTFRTRVQQAYRDYYKATTLH